MSDHSHPTPEDLIAAPTTDAAVALLVAAGVPDDHAGLMAAIERGESNGCLVEIADSYEVTATREGDGWMVRVPVMRFLYVRVAAAEEIEPKVRELIAKVTELEPDSFDVVVVQGSRDAFEEAE